jgi:hypothetical protein
VPGSLGFLFPEPRVSPGVAESTCKMDQTWIKHGSNMAESDSGCTSCCRFSTQITQAAGFNWLQVLPILRGLEQFGGETDPRRCARMGCHIILYIKFSIDGGFPKWAYPKNHGFQH